MGARALVLLLLVLACCNSPRLRRFLPPGAPFERAFGQLYLDGTTRKVSHYAVVDLSAVAVDLRTVATGTIEYRTNLDGMGNCLILRPKKYFSTPNRFDSLHLLPKPGSIAIGYCHLDQATVQTAVQAIYQARLSAAEAPAATTHFLAHDEGFTTVDVSADVADPTQSTVLGRAEGGKLYLVAFTEREDGTRRYANPMPYLAAVSESAGDLDVVAPTVADLVIETSATGSFTDTQSHSPSGDTIPGTVSRDHLRVAVRTTERTRTTGPVVVPYQIGYQLDAVTISGGSVVGRHTLARGQALLNQMDFTQATALAGKMYGATAPTTSDPSTGTYYIYVPWAALPAPDPEDARLNALDPTLPFSLDMTATAADGTPVFASGDYELHLTVADAVNPPAERRIRFTLGGGTTPPGDGEVSYTPSSGPLGTAVILTTTVPGAFVTGSATVSFTGTFTPSGTGFSGETFGSTSTFTIDYPTAKVTVIDSTHLSVRVGEVKPPLAILASAQLTSGLGGRLAGVVHLLGGAGYDHTVASFAFTVTESGRFGQMQGTSFVELETLPLIHAASATEVAAAPDFQRVVVELRVPAPPAPPPATADVKIHGLDASGATIDERTHTLGFVSVESGMAIYRSGAGGTRKLIFVETAALAGNQGSDLLAVHIAPAGGARISGDPP